MVALITAFYSFRLLFLVFLGKPRSFKAQMAHLHPTSPLEILSLTSLCFLSIFSGFLCQHFFVTLGSTFLHSFDNCFLPFGVSDFEFLPLYIKLTPTLASFLGLFLSFRLHRRCTIFTDLRRNFYLSFVFLSTKWGFDFIFNFFLARTTFFMSLLAADLFEKRLESFAIYAAKSFAF